MVSEFIGFTLNTQTGPDMEKAKEPGMPVLADIAIVGFGVHADERWWRGKVGRDLSHFGAEVFARGQQLDRQAIGSADEGCPSTPKSIAEDPLRLGKDFKAKAVSTRLIRATDPASQQAISLPTNG